MRIQAVLLLALLAIGATPADATRSLVGTWVGKATGPQGGPPTGELTIKFEKTSSGVSGTALVKGAGELHYSGTLSSIALKNHLFTAVATFKLGETPLEVRISGPMKARTIAGTFTVYSKGQKMGDGTFSVTKEK